MVTDHRGSYVGYLSDFEPGDIKVALAAPEMLDMLRRASDALMMRGSTLDTDDLYRDINDLLARVRR